MRGIGIVLLFFCLIVLGPLLTIWALNTLFGLSIDYTFKTWVATLLLSMAFGKTKIHLKGKTTTL